MTLDNAPKPGVLGRVGQHLRRTFIAGLLALFPLAVTFFVLRFFFTALDNAVQPLVERSFNREIPGVGIGIMAIGIYLMGLVVANFIGRRLVGYAENVILRVPIVQWFYNLTKQIIASLSVAGSANLRVVLVEWPKKGTYTIGFHTSTVTGQDGRLYHSVLIPTTPTPQTGLLAYLPEDEVMATQLTVAEGIRLVVSSGVLSPADLMTHMKDTPEPPLTQDVEVIEAALPDDAIPPAWSRH